MGGYVGAGREAGLYADPAERRGEVYKTANTEEAAESLYVDAS